MQRKKGSHPKIGTLQWLHPRPLHEIQDEVRIHLIKRRLERLDLPRREWVPVGSLAVRCVPFDEMDALPAAWIAALQVRLPSGKIYTFESPLDAVDSNFNLDLV